MPQRKSPRRKTARSSRPVEPPPEELGGGAKLDPTDLMAGLILVFAIPALVYVILDFVGLPVRGPGKTAAQMLDERDERKKRRPPLTAPEVKEQLDHYDMIVDDLAQMYLVRCRQEEEPLAKHRWWRYATTSLGRVKTELDTMLKPLEKNTELAAFVPRVKAVINEIRGLEKELDDLKVFVDN